MMRYGEVVISRLVHIQKIAGSNPCYRNQFFGGIMTPPVKILQPVGIRARPRLALFRKYAEWLREPTFSGKRVSRLLP